MGKICDNCIYQERRYGICICWQIQSKWVLSMTTKHVLCDDIEKCRYYNPLPNNLLKHLIVKIISMKDITDTYIKTIRMVEPNFNIDEKVFEVKLLTECNGCLKQHEIIWNESEFINVLGLGYFAAEEDFKNANDINEIAIRKYEYNRIMSKLNQQIKESMAGLEKAELNKLNQKF